MSNKTLTFTAKHSITEEELENIVNQASFGMTYWADSMEAVGEREKTPSKVVSRGGVIEIHDAEDDQFYLLDRAGLLRGLSITDNHNYDSWDMYDAERVIQRALFGKVIYG